MKFARRRVAVQLALVGLAALLPVGEVRAQAINGRGGEEIRLLREAAAREASGDFAGAERILTVVLGERPDAISALMSLERVLRVQGRLADLLGPVDRFLERDPGSAIGNRLRLQTLSDLNRVDELESAARDWMEATPKLETPYREIAKIRATRGEYTRAVQVLEEGRSRLGRDDALALELGEVFAVLGDVDRAVQEWDRAVGPHARGLPLVRRRLGALPDGGAAVLPGLIDALTRRTATPDRLRSATELAIDAGLGERAERIAQTAVAELPASEREAFLVEVARRADGAHLSSLAYWAYRALLESAGPEHELLALRMRLAELALLVGDTAAAQENFAIVEHAYAAGSPERRQATAVRIELTAREGRIDDALRELETFRAEYAEAPELDGLVAAVGDALLRRGDADRAEEVVANGRGPRSSLIHGRIALQRADIVRARRAFMTAAPGLNGAEATEVLSLVTLLGRLTPAGGELLGRALARAMHGDVPGAITWLVDRSEGLGREERAAILDFATGLADRADLPGESERIRRVIVAEHPDAPGAPAALLYLGRALARQPGRLEEARELLERLVLEYPRSALVPQARHELDRLHGRVPQS